MPIHGKFGRLIYDTYDLSYVLREVSDANTMDVAESTVFGAGVKSYVQGITDARISASGLFDATRDGYLSDALTNPNKPLVSAPQGMSASGTGEVNYPCFVGQTLAVSYQPQASVSDVVAFSTEWQCNTYGKRGKVLSNPDTAISATGLFGYGADVGRVAGTFSRALVTLQVLANTRDAGNLVVKVQHSATIGGTYVDLATFANVGFGTLSAQVLEATGTINRFFKVNVSTLGGTTGSVRFLVAAARLEV